MARSSVRLPPMSASPSRSTSTASARSAAPTTRSPARRSSSSSELRKDKISGWRWFLGAWGVGTYRQHDSVDVRYESAGQPGWRRGWRSSWWSRATRPTPPRTSCPKSPERLDVGDDLAAARTTCSANAGGSRMQRARARRSRRVRARCAHGRARAQEDGDAAAGRHAGPVHVGADDETPPSGWRGEHRGEVVGAGRGRSRPSPRCPSRTAGGASRRSTGSPPAARQRACRATSAAGRRSRRRPLGRRVAHDDAQAVELDRRTGRTRRSPSRRPAGRRRTPRAAPRARRGCRGSGGTGIGSGSSIARSAAYSSGRPSADEVAGQQDAAPAPGPSPPAAPRPARGPPGGRRRPRRGGR